MKTHVLVMLAAVCFLCSTLTADVAAPQSALAKMPVKEVTVFKDGHALMLHQGAMPVDAKGNVLMDYLPAPVLGAFWPYSADKAAKLTAVVAGQRKVAIERTALALRDLIEANVGAQVTVTEIPVGKDAAGLVYPATIVGVPTQSGEELEATSPPNTGEKLPIKGNVVLLKTDAGEKVVSIDRIQDIAFKGPHKAKVANEEFRNLLTLKLDWPDKKADKTAEVGLMYVQKGIRWIPEYKISLDDKGVATIKLQATLINEMVDLEDVTANLVVGVPTFAFKDLPDPIGLGQAVAQLSQHFREDSRTRYSLSNAMMSQSAARAEDLEAAPAPAGGNLGPEVTGGAKNEDLYVFEVKHVTLKKGERLVMPVKEFKLQYKDVYILELPFAPPPELRSSINNQQQAEIDRLMAAPKVMHKIRMVNTSDAPLTTAPALILMGEKVLAQNMMTYTAVGSTVDLAVTAAVDIRVKKTEKETQRIPNAETWQNDRYGRVDLTGSIALTNYKKEAVELEVTRYILGTADKAENDGTAEMINVFEDDGVAAVYPTWWSWYSWPYWWSHFNGIGKFTWKVKIEPDKKADLGYTWHYFWR